MSYPQTTKAKPFWLTAFAVIFNICALVALAFWTSDDASGVLRADNVLLTTAMVTYEALRLLTNNLGLASRINREYSPMFGIAGAKIGSSLNIRKPARFVGREGDALQVENTVETQTTLTLNRLIGVDVEFSEIDRALSLDNFSKRVLAPMVANIANRIDYAIGQEYKNIYNQVGTPGTVPSALSVYSDAGTRLKEEAAPTNDGNLFMGITPKMEGTIVPAQLAYFNPARQLSDQYKSGRMGDYGGFEFFMDQNMPTHTAATQSGSVTVNGAVSSGSSITVASLTSTGLKRGDTFTVADVYAVNPQSRMSTGTLRQFVVTADTAADSGGALAFSFSPAIVTSGQFQNVNAAMANGAAVTFQASTGRVYPMGLAFHRDAITMGTADLGMVRGVHECLNVADEDNGLTLRLITFYDGNTNKMVTRLETLIGILTQYPELACRVAS